MGSVEIDEEWKVQKKAKKSKMPRVNWRKVGVKIEGGRFEAIQEEEEEENAGDSQELPGFSTAGRPIPAETPQANCIGEMRQTAEKTRQRNVASPSAHTQPKVEENVEIRLHSFASEIGHEEIEEVSEPPTPEVERPRRRGKTRFMHQTECGSCLLYTSPSPRD